MPQWWHRACTHEPDATVKPGAETMEAARQQHTEPPTSLVQVLDELERRAREGSDMSVDDLVAVAGARTFAPLILLPGLVMLAPGLGDIPGVPVLMGSLVILVVVQMLVHRHRLWLPRWLGRRSTRAERVRRLVRWLRRPARFMDRWTRPRLTWAIRHGGFLVIAIAVIAVSMATPLMEVVPFSANLAGLVITAFGLALVSRDGLLALLASALALVTGVVVVQHLI